MEWLQKILSNAVYTQDGKLDVEATMKKINEEAPKHIVPKEQYNSKVKELDAANNTIKQLEKDAKDNPDLQKAIKDHEAAVKKLQEDHAEEIKGMKIDSAINKALSDQCAKHPELLAGKFDRSKIQVTDDGKVIGLDEQMKELTKSYKDMFGQTLSGKMPANPDRGAGGSVNTFDALVKNADNMTAEEVAAQFEAMAKQ
ncbi:MAG TPA: phage scaffolding protein [Candidatus Mediterraneibacter pullistercoris]|nr:phage scaffolding protein [Candidatus Mediterraneibacter pullistercoris]